MIYNGKPLFLAMVQIMFHSCCLACYAIGIINTNPHVLANLPRQKESLAPTKWDAGHSTGPVWIFWRREQALAPARTWPWIAQPTALSLYFTILALQDTVYLNKFLHEYSNKDAHYFQVSVWATCMHISFIIALIFILYISLALKAYILWYSSTLFIPNISFQSLKNTMLLTSAHNRELTVFPGGTSTSMP
jgi:hypothetical protein